MVLIYLIFRNVVEQPDSMINKTREPQLEMSRSVDSRCLFLPFEVKLSRTMFYLKLHPLGCMREL